MTTDVTSASPAGLASDCALATGVFTSDGNATSIVIGFNVRYIEVVNLTDDICWDKQQGFGVTQTLKSVTGAQTIDTSSAILFPADAGLNEPGSSVLLSAALCGTGKVIAWAAWG